MGEEEYLDIRNNSPAVIVPESLLPVRAKLGIAALSLVLTFAVYGLAPAALLLLLLIALVA